ncbi:hypothetical protein D5S18_09900 [Nocardia panacis]|uniref:Uncharacterized protein n=1 Tax=Nocardia panacis TaxID=2340916 RepID=A0A3A4KD16_9NOCA|nr:hypothetical protein [Nocardia panacis]RJO76591.1 hypothetical protein D5S18_09900 [Nocardia panacis]
MPMPEIGQVAARELYAAATEAGGADRFELSGDVAERLAAACDQLVRDLQQAKATGHLVTQVRGFPNLPTGQGLSRGFTAKGGQLLDLLTAFQETALLYKAAYLAAAQRLTAADAANSAALALIADHLEPS